MIIPGSECQMVGYWHRSIRASAISRSRTSLANQYRISSKLWRVGNGPGEGGGGGGGGATQQSFIRRGSSTRSKPLKGTPFVEHFTPFIYLRSEFY